jgi:hypothetical protein
MNIPRELRKIVFLSNFNKVILSADVINLLSHIINAVMNDAEIFLQSSTYIDLGEHK